MNERQPQVARLSRLSESTVEAKSRKGWGEASRSSLSRSAESRQPLEMRKGTARREGEVRRPLLPPQLTPNSHVMGRARLTQQLMTGGQAQAEGGRQESRVPKPLHHKCLQSAEAVWSPNLPILAQGASPIHQVGWGRTESSKPKTRPTQEGPEETRPDQSRGLQRDQG